ncbi:ankyrin repeat-containing domain protein, partial [Gautieria morchelliformis]
GSLLQEASSEGHTRLVRLLLEHGADPNAVGGQYTSALRAASLGGHLEIVRLLLERGADVNIQEEWSGSALQA